MVWLATLKVFKLSLLKKDIIVFLTVNLLFHKGDNQPFKQNLSVN